MRTTKWMSGVAAIFAAIALGTTATPASAAVVPNDLVIGQNATTGQVTIQQGTTLQAGPPVNITVSSAFPGGDVEIYQPQNGVSQIDIDQKLIVAGNGANDPAAAAAAMVWFRYNTVIYGGLSANGMVNYKHILAPGKYYVAQFRPVQDPTNPNVMLLPSNTAKSFRVVGAPQATLPYAPQKLSMNDVNGDKFIVGTVDGKLHTGQLLNIYNGSSELHFAQIIQMKPGTTDANVAAWIAGGTNPALPGGGVLNFGTQTPQGASIVTFTVPAGLYLVIDWIPDTTTGLPHALPPVNMYKLVTVI